YLGDRLIRTARPHRLLDPAAGPLIAVRLHVLLRKTLGGLETDLGGRVQGTTGLYAAGEASGFGGGGVHGHNALEGTLLGGCLFSARRATAGILEDVRGAGAATRPSAERPAAGSWRSRHRRDRRRSPRRGRRARRAGLAGPSRGERGRRPRRPCRA